MYRFAPALALGLLALFGGATVFAESGAEPTDLPESYLETVDVNVVNVDVYVTDKQGQRVEGLTRDDFELRVDGQRLPISNFYTVDARRSARDTALESLEQEATASRDGGRGQLTLEPLSVPEEQQLHLVIYVDNVNIHPASRERLMRFVRQTVQGRLDPADRVMVVSNDRKLTVWQGFTRDRLLVLDALREVDDTSAFANQLDSQRRDLLNGIYDNKERWEVDGRINQYISTVFREVQESIAQLQSLVDSLAGLPGRKAILYVSDGLAMRAGEDVMAAVEEVFEDPYASTNVARFDNTDRFVRLTQNANANRVTFYTVEAAGLRAYSFISAENATSRGGAQIDQIHFASLKDPLHMMAGETGGQAILGTNNFAPMLDRVVDDFQSYYSLGFQPVGVLGRYHHIEVVVPESKGLVVRHREGFRTRPPSARMGDATLAAVYYGYTSNELGVELDVGVAVRRDRELYEVPIVVRIPMGRLGFLPAEDKHSARVRLYIVVKSEDGAMSELQEVTVPIDISEANFELAQGHDYQFQHRLVMRRGHQMVAVGVRDEIGSTRSVVTRGLRVGG